MNTPIDLMYIVLKLTGPIEPVADSAIDAPRLENLKVLIDLTQRLHDRIATLAEDHKDSIYASQKSAGKEAHKYLEGLKE